jgi:hypothetical protein
MADLNTPIPLFGSEMVDVTTPDGRRVSLPAQLAAGFDGLTPALGGAARVDGSTAPSTPVFRARDALQPAPGTPTPEPSAPAAPVFTADDRDAIERAQAQVGSAPPARRAPPAISQPTGNDPARTRRSTPVISQLSAGSGAVPYTNASLLKQGTAGALNAELGAIDNKRAATRAAADVEGAQGTAAADILAAGNRAAAQADADRKRIADENATELRRRMLDYDEKSKALAAVKVDRSIDHPVIAAIALALGGIGSALKKEATNPALDVLFKVIDRKVAAQMADIEQRRSALTTQRGAIDLARQSGADRLAEYDQRKIAAIEQAKRSVDEYKTRTTSDRVRANADIVSAGLDAESAKVVGDATQREQQRVSQEQQHRDALGLQYAQYGETRRHNLAEEGIAEQQRAIAAAKLQREGRDDQAKLVRERALGGEIETDTSGAPVPLRGADGSVVVDPDGNPVPKSGLLKLKGGEIFIPNGTSEDVTRLHKQHQAVLKLIATQDEIRKLGPEWLSDIRNTDKKQKLDQLFSQALLQAIAANDLGVPTGHDVDLAKNFLGTNDPTRWRDSVAGIDQSRRSLIVAHDRALKAAGYDRDWSVPDLGNKGSVRRPDDTQIASLEDSRWGSDTSAARWEAEIGGVPWSSGVRSSDPNNVRARQYVIEHGNVLPSQAQTIASWGEAARGQDAKSRSKAVELLEHAANRGGNPAIRDLARQELTNSIGQYAGESAPGDQPAGATGRATARDAQSRTGPRAPARVNRDSAGNPI